MGSFLGIDTVTLGQGKPRRSVSRSNTRMSLHHFVTLNNVPLDFVEGFDLEDKRFEWTVKSGNTFELRVIEDDD